VGGQLDELLVSLAAHCLLTIFALMYFVQCMATNKYDW